MSMSTHIVALIPDTDATYQKHKKVLLACDEADVSLPKETADYFGCTKPDTEVLEEKLRFELIKGVHYKEYNAETSQGFEIDLKSLPKEIAKIRFYNSY
jgi:hypothetical protein